MWQSCSDEGGRQRAQGEGRVHGGEGEMRGGLAFGGHHVIESEPSPKQVTYDKGATVAKWF